MLHIRYSKSELAILVRNAIRAQQKGRISPLELQRFMQAIAEALEGKYQDLWTQVAQFRALIGVCENGHIESTLDVFA